MRSPRASSIARKLVGGTGVVAMLLACEVPPSASPEPSEAPVVADTSEDRGGGPSGALYTWIVISDEPGPDSCKYVESPGADIDGAEVEDRR
jgi:hypothetical protein